MSLSIFGIRREGYLAVALFPSRRWWFLYFNADFLAENRSGAMSVQW